MAKVKFVDSVWPLIIFLGLGVGILTGIALYCQVINPIQPAPTTQAGYWKKSTTFRNADGNWVEVGVESPPR